MKKIGKIATSLLIATALLSACGKSSSDQKKDSATIGLNTEVASLDTLKAQDPNSFDVQDTLINGLYKMDGKDTVVPDIAKGMPQKSKNNTVYTINLRHNAKWSNGASVTANDFVYAWKRGADPKTKSNYGYIIQTILKNGEQIAAGKMSPNKLGVRATGKYQLKVTLQKATPYFTSLLTFNPYFPQNEKFVEKEGSKYATSPSTMIYNGPYRLKSYSQGASTFTVTKNNNYVGSTKAKLKDIKFQIVKSTSTGLNQYEAKKLDVTFLSGNLVKNNKDKAGFKSIPNSYVTYLSMNINNKTYKNLDLRKALANTINTKELANNILADGSKTLTGFVPPKFVKNPATGKDFRAEGGNLNVPDKSKVASYWKAAQKQLGKKKLSMTLLIDDEDWQKTMAQYVQSQIEKNMSGATVTIKSVPQQQELSDVAAGKYEIALGQWGPDYQDPNTYLANYTSGHSNGFNNKQYDALMNKANGKDVNNTAKRYQDLHAAEKLLIQKDAALVPLNQQVYSIMQNPDLKGIQHHMVGGPFTYATAYWK